MAIPAKYKNSCVVVKPIPYELTEGDGKETQRETGTLEIGRVVYTDGKLREGGTEKVSAFAAGIGPVLIEASGLQSLADKSEGA